MFKRKSKNILYDDIKRDLRQKIIKYGSIIVILGIIISLAYYFIFGNKNKINYKVIDDKFERITLQNVSDFEKPTLNSLLYEKNNSSLGYFYHQDFLQVNGLPAEIKILSTINEMYKCFEKTMADNACGIKISNTPKSKYMVNRKVVLNYAKLLYGPDVQYFDTSSSVQYGNIINLNFIKDDYYFDVTNQAVNFNGIKEYRYKIQSFENKDKEVIIIKTVVYVEEAAINNKVLSYSFYNLSNKEKTIHTEKDNPSKDKLDIYLNDVFTKRDLLTFKFTYTKQEDGSLTFKQVEKIPLPKNLMEK